MALGILPLLLKGAEAAEFRVNPTIRLGQGWDSNIFGTSGNEVSDFYATVTPELVFTLSNPTLSMQLLVGDEGRWYYDNPDVSTAGYSKYLHLTAIDNGWKPTARVSVFPGAYFLETRDPTARAFLIPADPTVPTPSVPTYGLQKSRDYGASIRLVYQATAVVSTEAMVYGAAHQLPDQPGGLYDSKTLGADVSARYTISERSYAGAYVNGSKEYFHETPDSRVFGAGLLGGHQISPAFRIDGRLGIAFARQPATATDNSEHTVNDPAGTITLAYTDNTFMATMYATVGYSGLSGVGEVTRDGTVGFTLADQFAQFWSWTLGGSYTISRTVFAVTSSDTKTLNGTGSIRYAPWEWGAFDLTGNSNRQQSDVSGGDLNRYTVVLGFTLGRSAPGSGYIIF